MRLLQAPMTTAGVEPSPPGVGRYVISANQTWLRLVCGKLALHEVRVRCGQALERLGPLPRRRLPLASLRCRRCPARASGGSHGLRLSPGVVARGGHAEHAGQMGGALGATSLHLVRRNFICADRSPRAKNSAALREDLLLLPRGRTARGRRRSSSSRSSLIETPRERPSSTFRLADPGPERARRGCRAAWPSAGCLTDRPGRGGRPHV